jgi:hypothetical protein
MNREAERIARELIDQHGAERAYREALEGGIAAQKSGDFYRLSVWREVKQIINQREINRPEISDLDQPPIGT